MARERQREYHGNQYDRTSVNVDKSPNKETASVNVDKSDSDEPVNPKPIDVRKEIASAAKVSTGTLAKFDKVQKERPDLVEKIVSDEMTINKAYNMPDI